MLVLALCCSPRTNYRERADAFLKDYPPELVVETLVDDPLHCIIYIDKATGNNVIKYDLKKDMHINLLKNDDGFIDPSLKKHCRNFKKIQRVEKNYNCYALFVSEPFLFGNELVLYDIRANKWYYLGQFPLEKVEMNEHGITCVCVYDDPSVRDSFGKLTWRKSFDLCGACRVNTVHDSASQRDYDGARFIEADDSGDYVEACYRENLTNYLMSQTLTSDQLFKERKENLARFNQQYRGKWLLVGGTVSEVTGSQSGYAYCCSFGNMFNGLLYCHTNDQRVLSLNKGESVILYARFSGADEVHIYMKDARIVDEEIYAYYEHLYMEYLATVR